MAHKWKIAQKRGASAMGGGGGGAMTGIFGDGGGEAGDADDGGEPATQKKARVDDTLSVT